VTAVVIAAGLAAILTAAFLAGTVFPFLFLGIAVSQVPNGRPAAYLLMGAAALGSMALDQGRRVAVLGLPGGIAAAVAIAGGPVTVGRVAGSVALAVTALLLATQEADAEASIHPVVLAGSAWLLLAPTTIRWQGDAGLGPYQAGVLRAVVAGVPAVAIVRVLRWRRSHASAS
jgi:hypothetical protein